MYGFSIYTWKACLYWLRVLLLIWVLASLLFPPWAHSYYNYITNTQQNVTVLQQTVLTPQAEAVKGLKHCLHLRQVCNSYNCSHKVLIWPWQLMEFAHLLLFCTTQLEPKALDIIGAVLLSLNWQVVSRSEELLLASKRFEARELADDGQWHQMMVSDHWVPGVCCH